MKEEYEVGDIVELDSGKKVRITEKRSRKEGMVYGFDEVE